MLVVRKTGRQDFLSFISANMFQVLVFTIANSFQPIIDKHAPLKQKL